MITLPPHFEEIHEDNHVRCNVVDGKAIDHVTIRDWKAWDQRTHDVVVFRNRITGESILIARAVPVLKPFTSIVKMFTTALLASLHAIFSTKPSSF